MSDQSSGGTALNRRVFVVLDRDGTIIVERNHLSDPDEVELLPTAAEGLRRLRLAGLGLVVVTNQSAIGRGIIDDARLQDIHRTMEQLLESEGVVLDGIYYCPHHPDDGCGCRKPGTQLLESAAADHGFYASNCFVIGDKASDIELGQNVGATTILVRSGYGDQVANDGTAAPTHIASGLGEAAQWILNRVSLGLTERVG
ncbi:MAG: HAD family hydrolase [Chloroflexi bacterium]|nr:HAD family hydrolase [Chloroflexota bacterium]